MVQEPVVVEEPAPEPVEEAVAQLPQIPVGSTIQMTAENLGAAPGQVIVKIGPVVLAATVNDWKSQVTTTIPMVGLEQPTPAELMIVRADGSLASAVAVELTPAVQPQQQQQQQAQVAAQQ